MPKTYTTRSGDTFSSISMGETGSAKYAQTISQANPHAKTPIAVGTQLIIPGGDTNSIFKPLGLDCKIDGASMPVYDSFTVSSALDGFSKVSLVVPNEPEIRAKIPMLSPVAVDVGYDGAVLFSGYLESPKPVASGNKKQLQVGASSWPNLLSSPAPTSLFPAEFKNMKIDAIAKAMFSAFNVNYSFFVDAGPVFNKVSMEQTGDVLSFFAGLCKQRAIIMRDDEFGTAVFDNGDAYGEPILNIDDDKNAAISVAMNVSPQGWYSHVTALLRSKRGRSKTQLTWKNPFYKGVLRPYTFEIEESDDGELLTAMDSVSARMFASVFSLQVVVPSWNDKNGDLFRVGNVISLKSPTNYINDSEEFLIDGLTLFADGNQKVATLNCVLPGVYAGKIPEAVPWI